MQLETGVLLLSKTCEIVKMYKEGYKQTILTIVKNGHIISFDVHDGFDIGPYNLEQILISRFPTVRGIWLAKALTNVYDKKMTSFAIFDKCREVFIK